MFLLARHFAKCALKPVRKEHRIIAKPALATRRPDQRPVDLGVELFQVAVRPGDAQRRDKMRAPLRRGDGTAFTQFRIDHLHRVPEVLVRAGPARRVDAGITVKRIDRETGIVGESRMPGRTRGGHRFDARVVGKRRPGLRGLGERQITVDCDVIQADGGTRTASITAGWVALHDCIAWMRKRDMLTTSPLRDHVAAISCGVCGGTAVLDLDYAEDSAADTDANFVMTGDGRIVEVQGTAEKEPFSEEQLLTLLALARKGVAKLVDLQKMAVT